MAAVAIMSMKRPFEETLSEQNDASNPILIGDSDTDHDEPPAKRQRSASANTSTPPASTNTDNSWYHSVRDSQGRWAPVTAPNQVARDKSTSKSKSPPPLPIPARINDRSSASAVGVHSRFDGAASVASSKPQSRLRSPLLTATRNHDRIVPQAAASRHSSAVNGLGHQSSAQNGTNASTPESSLNAPQSNELAPDLSILSLRPSQNPSSQNQSYRQPPLKRSHSQTSVIDLDSDEETQDKVTVASKALEHRSISPIDDIKEPMAADFQLPKLKPIRFDPTRTSEQSQPTTKPTTYQPDTRPHLGNTVQKKTLVQIPTRPSQSTQRPQVLPPPRLVTSRPPQSSQSSHPQTSSTTSKSQVLIDVPPTPYQRRVEREKHIKLMIENANYFQQNGPDIAEVTGVAAFDNTDLDTRTYKRAAQKKQRPAIDRSKVKLDLLHTPKSEARKAKHEDAKYDFVNPKKQARDILNERFKHQQDLNFENYRNERKINGKFQFISELILSRKIRERRQAPLPARACECLAANGSCDLGCPCATSKRTKELFGTPDQVDVLPYRRRPDGRVVLADEFLNAEKVQIFECSHDCKCPPTCVNRVVQKGRTIPLTIFETPKCGLGVKSTENIFEGQFIDNYLGEVITYGEMVKREQAADEDTPSYVMTLDMFVKEEISMFNIDGANFGSVTRFVNHSCDPNCKVFSVVSSGDTKHLYHVSFFARRDIPAGTELTIDYDPSLQGIDVDITDSSIVQCQCGAENCRRQLWAPSQEKRARKRAQTKMDDD